MSTLSLLYKKEYKICDIPIRIPTMGEVMDNEDLFYSIVSTFTLSPIDLMVQLDDLGVDFEELKDYELFLMLFSALKEQDTSMVFGDLDFSKFEMVSNTKNQSVFFYDEENDIKIDKRFYLMASDFFRKLLGIKKDRRRPANKVTKKFMLERARIKLERQKNKNIAKESQNESLIIAMVNTEQFKYNFDEVKDLTIYQFNQCVKQIMHKVEYDNRMIGVYTGNIRSKDLKQDDYNWIASK